MTFGEINFSEALPEETMAIANAIAERTSREEQLVSRVAAEVNGLHFEVVPAAATTQAKLGRTVLLMARVDDPSVPVSTKELFDAALKDGGYKAFAEQWSKEDFTIEEGAVRSIYHAFADELQSSSGITDQVTSEQFAKQLTAAREVASERGATVAEVYSDDELYGVAVRKAFTPEEYTENFEKVLTAFTQDMMSKMMLKMLDTILPKEILEEVGPEEISELALEMQLDTELQANLAGTVDKLQEAMKQFYVCKMVELWGYGELDKLSQAQKDALMPRQPWASIILDKLNKI